MSVDVRPVQNYFLKSLSIPADADPSSWLVENFQEVFPLPETWEFGEGYLLRVADSGVAAEYLAWILEKGQEGVVPASFAQAASLIGSAPQVAVTQRDSFFEVIVFRDDGASVSRTTSIGTIASLTAEQPAQQSPRKVRFDGRRTIRVNPVLEKRARLAKKYIFTAALACLAFLLLALVANDIDVLDKKLALGIREADELETVVRSERDLLRAAEERLVAIAPQQSALTRISAIASELSPDDVFDTISLQGTTFQFSGTFQEPVELLARLKDAGRFKFVELALTQGMTFRGEFVE